MARPTLPSRAPGGVRLGPGAVADVVVDDGVVVVVDVIVVVVADWHTEMLTVVPLLTCAPAAGRLAVDVAGLGPAAHSWCRRWCWPPGRHP